jgi:hypothetical protein
MSFWLVHRMVTGSLMNKKYGNTKKFYRHFLMLGYNVQSNLDADVNMN